MKKIFLLIMVVIAIACSSKRPAIGYKIFGNIKGLDSGTVVLKKFMDGKWINADTGIIQGGLFTLEGNIEQPEMCRLAILNHSPEISLFLDNQEITVSGVRDSLSQVRISGSAAHEEYEAFWGSQQSIILSLDSVGELYKKIAHGNDKKRIARLNKLDSLNKSFNNQLIKNTKTYVLEKKASSVSAYLIWSQLIHQLDVKELDSISKQMDPVLNQSIYIKSLHDYITLLKNVNIGKPARDFTMNDIHGQPLKLSSFYGKILLVDFWASWSSPCRAENPNLVYLYRKYHAKGFNILGISFDKNRKDWINAVKKDHLSWIQLSDLSFWDNSAGKLYGIRNIPYNILLDKNGTILAKNIHGKELKNRLTELLQN